MPIPVLHSARASLRTRATRVTLAALVALATLSACADQPTGPRAAPVAGPSRLLVGSGTAGGYAQVSAGGNHTCAATTAGTVVCWGDNTWHQTDVPSEATDIVQVSAGYNHTCALGSAGTVTCWGDIRTGATDVPSGLVNVKQISAGYYHTCALSTAGAVTCWGTDNVGQLDVPSEAQSGIAQIGAGYFHTCSVSTAGAVICWGYNADQQATVPAGLGSVTEVSAGFYHTCALTTAGAVTCWGDNGAGQTNLLGAAQSGIAHIDAGGYHTCALSTAGVVNCWGFNNSGQSSAPPTLTVMKQVSAGGIHSCEVSTAGAVTCWGNNGNGQTTVPTLPGGTTHLFPTATFAAPATVVAGQSITLALTDAQVPGHPEATRFTYAFDCGSGAFAAVTSSSTASCATSVAGPRTVRGQVIDQDQDATPYSAVVTVLTPTQATQQLRAAVAASGISAKVAAGLIDKLDAALTALGRGQTATALSQLGAFQQLVMAQRGKAIPAATADAWLAQSAAIRQALGG